MQTHYQCNQTMFATHLLIINLLIFISSATAEGPHDRLHQLKSCQIMHSCVRKIPILQELQWVNDNQGHSRSLELPLFRGPYTTTLVVCSSNDSICKTLPLL